MLKKLTVLAALVVVTLIVTPLRAEIFEQVLVKVNGDIVTKLDFEQRQFAEIRNRPELANANAASAEVQKAVAETAPDLILAAVDELLLIQRGRDMGFVLRDEQFNEWVAGIRKTQGLEDEEKFKAALAQEGLTMPELRKNLERNMVTSEVQRREVMDKISVTEDEARAYYDSRQQDFTSPTEITLREILIEVPTSDRGVNVAQDEELRARAEDTRKRLLAGEPFPRLAADVSTAPSKANGGLIGPLNRNELNQALQKLLDGLKVGEISEVLRTQRGYQILKLESRSESKLRTFEEARGDISARVAEQKRLGEVHKYLEGLRATATITWRNAELQKAYEFALNRRRERVAAAAK
jgi:peptidyl-prolyl cis-trans isomerase SurA